ncbi:rod shape-determining protein MreC [Thiothrix subterranea]|nr:rod shape-determining protein MreC [Thiothrix subterranea]QQZ28577.1 rod shape-determining protein MreC [Thiothrix subterranea]WML88132.1 rod shape-determining protein MreC [Thiothrix subterranea]
MLLILCALVLMAVDNRNPASLSAVRTVATMMVYPLLYSVDFPQQAYQRSSGFLTNQQQLADENLILRQQVGVFSAQQQDLDKVMAENQRLRTMLNAAPRETYTFTMAEILEIAQDPVRGLVTLNKGSNDAVQESQVVLHGNKIYGQVVSVTPLTSNVMQLIDIGHSIPVESKRTGERGLANGDGRGRPIKIENLPASSTVKPGDVFVSSGLGGLFAAGYEVATVLPGGVDVKQGDPFATVLAMPAVDYEAVREVLLVWKNTGDADAR